MEFTKKFWNDGKYIGISNGEYYNYYTGEKLDIKPDNYYTSLMLSNENFNRNFVERLNLPYKKSDIQLAANDFLYSSTLRDIIQKLQINNQYIYRNAIIADGKLPAVSLSTDINGKFYKQHDNYILSKLNNKIHTYKIKKNNGTWSENASSTVSLTKNNGGYKSTDIGPTTKIDIITKDWLNDSQENEATYKRYHSNGCSQQDIIIDKLTNISLESPSLWSFSEPAVKTKLNDRTDLTGKLLTFNCYETETTEKAIKSLIEVKDINTSNMNTVYFRLDSISFITTAEKDSNGNFKAPKITLIQGGPKTQSDTSYVTVQDDGKLNEGAYCFISQQEIEGGHYINTIHFSNRHYFHGQFGCLYEISRDSKATNASFIDKIISEIEKLNVNIIVPSDSTIKYIKNNFVLKGNIGFKQIKRSPDNSKNIGFSLSDFEYIPNITKQLNYSFRWTDGVTTYTDEKPDTTYGALRTSVRWLNGGKNSKLVYKSTGNGGSASYIPNDDMTANDVYEATKNSHIIYEKIPNLISNTLSYKFVRDKKSESIPYIKNPLYKARNYPLETYDWFPSSPGNNIGSFKVRYKTAKEIWNELQLNNANSTTKNNNSDPNQALSIPEKIFDNLPTIKEEIRIDDNQLIGNLPEFNYLDINDAEVLYKNNKFYYFIAFSDKLLIIKADKTNDKLPEFLIPKSNDSVKYIYIKEINSLNVRIAFKHINSLKIYENDLYISDSKLNAVIQYNIEHLLSPKEDELVSNMLIVKNMLQGDGSIKNKLYFNKPTSLAISKNKVYVVDKNNRCIKIYNRNLNYIKTIKNGKYSTHDIQAIAINPHSVYLENGTKVHSESLWVISKHLSKLYLSIYFNEELLYNTHISNITLETNQKYWEENVKNIIFSFCDSNYYYIVTSYHTYKAYTTNPKVLIGSYTFTKNKDHKNKVDQRCFAICGNPEEEYDYIFNIFNIYDTASLEQYTVDKSFNDLSVAEKVECINKSDLLNELFKSNKSNTKTTPINNFITLFFKESLSYISTLNSKEVPCDTQFIHADTNDYINALTLNKMLYSLISNLYNLKNSIIGTLKTVALNNNIVSVDNIELDTYYNLLEAHNTRNYFVYDNELINVGLNRIFESIYNLQFKILEKMQSLHLSFDETILLEPKII